MKIGRYFAILALILTAAVVLAQLKISQYPNTSSPQATDLLLLASGSTNKNIRWDQFMALITNFDSMTVTNLYALNMNATNGYFIGANTGSSLTNDVIVSGSTTTRMVFKGGILISNIPNFY